MTTIASLLLAFAAPLAPAAQSADAPAAGQAAPAAEKTFADVPSDAQRRL